MMKKNIRSRIQALNRLTMLGAVLTATLVVVASLLPVDQKPANATSTSPIHSRGASVEDVHQTAATPNEEAVAASTEQAPARTAGESSAEATPAAQPTPEANNRIGILAGHWGYDSGAICADGLREVDITMDIAQRAATRLQALGYDVEILKEHHPDMPQPPLQNYQAAAFIALHADSCIPGVSGFKVSRWAFSQMPAIEDQFVKCIYDKYSAATGLSRHDDSITIDMWNYYAFREIGKKTPGAIIELGFMVGDRWLLVQRPDLAAKGIADGVVCFLENAGN